MIDEIKSIIERVYENKDYKFYGKKCKDVINLPESIVSYVENRSYKVIDFYEVNEASKKWSFKLKDFELGEFKVSYKTSLEISKIGPFFYIQHEFSVYNLDTDKIQQTLDGFDSEPFTKEQASLYDKIKVVLNRMGYIELSYMEMNEVVLENIQSHHESIYGNQLTVEGLIFHNVLDISGN